MPIHHRIGPEIFRQLGKLQKPAQTLVQSEKLILNKAWKGYKHKSSIVAGIRTGLFTGSVVGPLIRQNDDDELMARFRSGMALRPINRIKHVVDAEGGTTAGVVSVIDLIETKDAPVIANTNECITASKVNGFYLKVEVLHSSGAGRSNMYMMIYKNPGNSLTSARPIPNAVGGDNEKRFVIHQEMIMLNGDAGNGQPRVLFNGVIKIPKGYIRNGPNDKLQCVLFTPTVLADFCLQCHYKEFR